MTLPEHLLFLDIETLPCDEPDVRASIAADIQPPASYKKPESIAAWLAENREAETDARLARTGLDGLYGRICVIGWAVGEGPVMTERLGRQGDAEELLCRAIDGMQAGVPVRADGTQDSVVFVGHNIDWDARFLFHQLVRESICIPPFLRAALDPVDGRRFRYDTMQVWAGYRERVKLKALAGRLLGDTCDDIDGSEVASTWASRPELVSEHCARDVMRVRALYRRFCTTLGALA